MKFNKQSGQVLVGAAVALVVLCGFAGLAIDMGALRYQKRVQQTAADSAAIAGASNLTYTGYQTAAQAAAAQNGFTDLSTNDLSQCATGAAIGTVCVQVSPSTGPADVTFNGKTISGGPHTGDANYVEVLVAKVQRTYFMTLLGVNSETIVARAVATNTGGGAAGGGGCIYTLGTPTAKVKLSDAGIGASGSVTVVAPTCGIVDNGNMVASGGAQLSVQAGSIGVGGQYNGPGCTVGPPVVGVCPPPSQGTPYSGDPFASKWSPMPPPPTTGTNFGDVSAPSGTTTTFTPGIYNKITVNNNANVVFSPGTYEVTDTFKVNGTANICGGGTAVFSGSTMTSCTYSGGVTFDLTGNGSVNINGTSDTQMYAPNSGTYEGLLFYQDPSDTNPATLNGTSDSLYQGAIYMPTADLNFGGNTNFNNGAAYTVIVVNQLDFSGNPYVNLNSNFSGLAGGGGPLAGVTKWATLVE
jgi:hypothetical protein